VSNQDRFILWLSSNALAKAATISVITGTVCPCKAASRDGISYSKQWHRDNPAPGDEACSGTLLIDRTTTVTNIKAVFYAVDLGGNTLPRNLQALAAIGEIQKDDLFMIGTYDVDNNAYYDLSDANWDNDFITYNSTKYIKRNVSDIPADIGQSVVLKRSN